MLNFLQNIETTLKKWNITSSKWSDFNVRVVEYWTDWYNHNSPWYGKAVKLLFDTWDYVSYNACAFMGMLLCALILF